MSEPAQPRALVALHRFSRAVAVFKLVCWTVFAAVGPAMFLVMKNYVGVAVTSGCSLLIAWLALGPDVTSSPLRPALRAFLAVQGLAGAALAAHALIAPPDGWTHELDVPGPTLAEGPDGSVIGLPFAGPGHVFVRAGARGVSAPAPGSKTTWAATPFPGTLVRGLAFSPTHQMVIASENRTPTLWVRPWSSVTTDVPDPSAPLHPGLAAAQPWSALAGPDPGAGIVITTRSVLLTGRGSLERLSLPSGRREIVPGLGVVTVACAAGDRVLAVQAAGHDRAGRSWESTDDALTFHDLPGFQGEADHCAIAHDGAAYVASSGVLTGTLWARASGGVFQEREPPLPRVESLRVNPANGREVWIAGWGGGVFRSLDGAVTWEHLGLEGFEVESIVVDFAAGTVLAAAGSGIYTRRFTPR